MVRHVILWKLKEEYAGEAGIEVKKGIKAGLEGLMGQIPGLLGITVTGLCATAIMCSVKSFGVPFFAPYAPVTKHREHLFFRTRIENRGGPSDRSNPQRRRV